MKKITKKIKIYYLALAFVLTIVVIPDNLLLWSALWLNLGFAIYINKKDKVINRKFFNQ